MSKKDPQSKSSLILPGESSPAKRRSQLVKRGLDLSLTLEAGRDHLHQDKKEATPQLRVLMGINEGVIASLLTELLKAVTVGRYELRIEDRSRCEELVWLADQEPFEMFVVLLNNIIHQERTSSVEERLAKSLDLLTYLKRKFGKPIIALSGLPEYTERALLSGAKFSFPLPISPARLGTAFEECLRDIDASRRATEMLGTANGGGTLLVDGE